MMEPSRGSGRRTSMKVLLIVVAFLVAGCGNTVAESGDPAAAVTKAPVGSCSVDDPALATAKSLGTADLGLGSAQVALTGPMSPCPNTIFTHAPEGTAFVSLTFEPTATDLIMVGGDSIVTARQEHPRGGFQQHLYAVNSEAELIELLDEGNPLLPFVALDTRSPHAFADCDAQGLKVLTAPTTEPAGVVMAYDVFSTNYTVEEGVATAGAAERVEHSIPDSQIRKAHPDLFSEAWFEHCS